MEGIQSFEQRSVIDYSSRGNRVIIVNRREPLLDWTTTSETSSRLTPSLSAIQASGSRFYSWLCCDISNTKDVSLGKPDQSAGKKQSSNVLVPSHPAQLEPQATFDFGPFPTNVWKTSKYTLWNFLPKNLFEQFRRLANFYFLITAIIQVVIPFSPIGPSTSLIPLAFVISTTAIKQAYEDYLRHKLDKEVNNRMCSILGSNKKLTKVRSKDIRVGDIVFVQNNEEMPCDMILLASSGTSDRCYVTTANLDGETSLKGRTCFQIRQQVGTIDKINETMIVLECEKPNATLYEFNGFLRAPKDKAAQEELLSDLQQLEEFRKVGKDRGRMSSFWRLARLKTISTIFRRIKQTNMHTKLNKQLTSEQLKNIGAEFLLENRPNHVEIPLDVSNLLLRASRLRNTSFIYGLAVYTGPDTRLAYNSHVKPNKFSSLETRVNMFLAIAFLLLLTLTFVSALRYSKPSPMFMDELDKTDSFFQILMAHFVLYNYLVPISLYVTLEFVKFLGTISVLEDKKLKTTVYQSMTQPTEPAPNKSMADVLAASSPPLAPANPKLARSLKSKRQVHKIVGPQCNSSDLNEDLGQVEVLFSDKTGTLTENRMLFMACSIDGQLYRSISGYLYQQPEGLCYMPTMNVAQKLLSVAVNRYGALANELAQVSSPRSIGGSHIGGCNRSSRSHSNKLAKLPLRERPFDHRVRPALRDMIRIDSVDKREEVVEFMLGLCLCSTITLNEQTPLKDCLPNRVDAQYDYQSASPDEESLISAAAQFGVIFCKSNEHECYIAIKRSLQSKRVDSPQSPSNQVPQIHRDGPTVVRGNFRCIVETKNSNEQYIVRQFERLITFEFNSVRKRMSVLYRDCDNDCIVMFTKGSETVLDCIGISEADQGGPERPKSFAVPARFERGPKSSRSRKNPANQASQERVINKTLAHFEAFSKSGLRTMLAAKRLIDAQTYEGIKNELHNSRLLSSPESREHSLAALYRRVESNMSLIGSTAVEDSLQEGVPETIDNLKDAGIKVWLLTGDKVETAISVAYLCKLLDRNMNLLHLVRQQDFEVCKNLLATFVDKIKVAQIYGDEDEFDLSGSATASSIRETVGKRPLPHSKTSQAQSGEKSRALKSSAIQPDGSLAIELDDAPRFALIADGRSLHYAMKHAREELEFVSTNCVCVLGCRLSPLQKAEIVEMIKNGRDKPITAAIGDGANDVSMIQEAHVGIGISGKEGRQAVNSSDFAINRFYMVKRLFFVHGHLFYYRTATTIHYFFYKNLLFVMPQFLYSFYNMSSAKSLYNPVMLITYNMLFTSLPILIFGLSERNIQEDMLEMYPRLYRINNKNRLMRYGYFLAWLTMGTVQALIIFYFVFLIWGSHTPLMESGKPAGPVGLATILFSGIVLGVTLRLYFISKNRTYLFDAASILSCIALPTTLWICSLFNLKRLFDDNSLYGQYAPLIASPAYWIAIFTSTTAMIVPEIIGYVREQIMYYRMLNSVVKRYASKIADRNKTDASQVRRNKRRNKKNGASRTKDKDRDRDREKDNNKDKDREKEEDSTTSKRDPGYQEIIGTLVAGKFKLIKLLGSGSYGAVYLGKNIVTSEQVAVKLEHKATKAPQLPLEYRFIKMIGSVEGFPRIIRIDECAGTYHAMIMELLGPSLEEVFNVCERRMGLKSVLYLTLQLISRFQLLHSKNIIYRDVKPENFLLGRQGMDKENTVHIIDYGLAKEYINPESGTHIAFRGQRGAIGTARYMSVNTHLGKEQSRRDDLEALGYVIIYFMRGSLPWQGLPATDHRERMRKIGEMKRRLPVEEICDRCPVEFASYLRYVRELDFYEAPDYEYLKKIFQDLFIQNRFLEDGSYDWSGRFEAKSA